MSIPYIDGATLQAEIAHFLPSITFLVGFIPGSFGNILLRFLKLISNPLFIGPVVDTINGLSGASPPPPGMLRAPPAAPPQAHVWDGPGE